MNGAGRRLIPRPWRSGLIASATALFAGIGLSARDAASEPAHRALPDLADLTREARLPLADGLNEVSGLAPASAASVYAHNDEYGIVYEIDLASGAASRAFAFGRPTVRGDFEAVAMIGERIYLANSDGMLYEAPIGRHRERVRYHVYDTGAGALCETEGLAVDPATETFFLLCKTPRDPSLTDRLVILQWRLADRSVAAAPLVNRPFQDVLPPDQQNGFLPTALDFSQASGGFAVLSSAPPAILTVGLDGTPLDFRALDPALHRQAEGVAIMADGRVAISDEGAPRSIRRRARGMLTVYAPPR